MSVEGGDVLRGRKVGGCFGSVLKNKQAREGMYPLCSSLRHGAKCGNRETMHVRERRDGAKEKQYQSPEFLSSVKKVPSAMRKRMGWPSEGCAKREPHRQKLLDG